MRLSKAAKIGAALAATIMYFATAWWLQESYVDPTPKGPIALEDDDPDLLEAEDETSRTSTALFEQMDLIFTFWPSTVAGVAVLLKYISTLEDWQMPPGLDDSDSMMAVKTLCTCLAAAIEQSAVQS